MIGTAPDQRLQRTSRQSDSKHNMGQRQHTCRYLHLPAQFTCTENPAEVYRVAVIDEGIIAIDGKDVNVNIC